MISSKDTLTIRHLLCYVFIFGSFFLVFTSGFTWIQTPGAKTYAEIGKSVTLRWNYKLNISQNETHHLSDVGFVKKGNTQTSLALKVKEDEFEYGPNDLSGKYEVHGKQNISLILKDVQESFDRTFCLKTKYKLNGLLQAEKSKCTKLCSFAYPLVDFSPKATLVNVTDLVNLYCNATGKPQPNIIWKKADDPSEVLAPSSSWFNLSVTGPSVQGLYMCIANNSFGTNNKTFFVEVQFKPKIQYISMDQIHPEGARVSLYCNASGNPIPNIAWEATGNTMTSGQGNATLKLANISKADTGEYNCTAKNILGMTSKKTRLTVQYRPVETTLTADPGTDVILGRKLVLNCTSSALPKANQFHFYRNGSFLKNVTDGLLSVDNITSTKSGEYKCIPSNTLGDGDPATVMINVLEPPVLSESLKNRTINESETLELRCKAKGNPLPVVTWTKNSKFLSHNDTYKKENTSRNDAGVYRCTANNSIGEPVYSEATVIVNYAPEVTINKSKQTVNETHSASLDCQASGKPAPRVQWFKENVSIGNESVTLLTNVTWKDAGKYVCKAYNLLGIKSATTELIVQYSPINTKLTTHTGEFKVAVNDTLILNCSAQAFPPANQFTFSSNKTTLQSSPKSTFIIKKPMLFPDEEYTCIPENIMGSGPPSSINISYLEQPSFRQQPETNITVNEAETIKLVCLVRGKPKPNVTWTRDGVYNVIGTGEEFIKNNTNSSDAGQYNCTASNGVGRILSASFSVEVNYKPINTRLSITGRRGITINESLTLNCSAQSNPPPHIFSFQVNGSKANHTPSESTFVIKKDRAFYDESYTCIATNLLGGGEKSDSLIITMLEPPTICTGPKNVTVNETEAITLKCQARGKPPPKITWTKGSSTDILSTNDTYSKARAETCDAGVYRCTASNGVKTPVSAQFSVTIKSFPLAPEILNIAKSIPSVEVHWEQPVTNCSLPITGYIARVKKKESQDEWTECEALHVRNYTWTCSFRDLQSSTTYTLQIIAKNRFGRGNPAEEDFETKDGGSASGSSDARTGGLSKKSYIIIGASVGGFFLLVIIILVGKRLKTKHGESSLQTPIELREPDEVPIDFTIKNEIQYGHDGPMSASQETLEIQEKEDGKPEEDRQDQNVKAEVQNGPDKQMTASKENLIVQETEKKEDGKPEEGREDQNVKSEIRNGPDKQMTASKEDLKVQETEAKEDGKPEEGRQDQNVKSEIRNDPDGQMTASKEDLKVQETEKNEDNDSGEDNLAM
ncbi:immunoglobulin superfamily member 10-like [Actinia tenebrosa]|uniref:Immunoglobulin superfamily member 10-like n=1 Tax=Actinia tenebrosa TaxID=6105 RepID=A0A6P8INL5_ACTTE|nr:immunoglobulin superfamily member 10-like [Actinia tenebrosa]